MRESPHTSVPIEHRTVSPQIQGQGNRPQLWFPHTHGRGRGVLRIKHYIWCVLRNMLCSAAELVYSDASAIFGFRGECCARNCSPRMITD